MYNNFIQDILRVYELTTKITKLSIILLHAVVIILLIITYYNLPSIQNAKNV